MFFLGSQSRSAGIRIQSSGSARRASHPSLQLSGRAQWGLAGHYRRQNLAASGFVDDQAIWDRDGEGFRHAVSGLGLQASYTEIEKPTELRLGDGCVSDDGNIASEPGVYIVEHGPEKLPSEYLQTLCEKGWVSLTCILSPSVVDRLQRVGCVGAYEGRKPEMKHPLAQDRQSLR